MKRRKKIKNAALAALMLIGVSAAALLALRAQVRERREKKTLMNIYCRVRESASRPSLPEGESLARYPNLPDGRGRHERATPDREQFPGFVARRY